ncbi:MAG: arylsulfatase A-like enzyme [Pirellulaceae bacterium]
MHPFFPHDTRTPIWNPIQMKQLAISLLVVLLTTIVADAQQQRPNILFIMTDQQFADAMSCRMGDQYIHTPAIDSLAKSGVVFTRAYVPNPLCMPSRNSIFTGLYPHQTGVTRNARGNKGPESLTCMGTYFKNAGYQTAYFGKWHLIFNTNSIEQHGFEKTSDIKRVKYWDTHISSSAIKYLSAKQEKPFLAVVSFHNPHDACELARGQTLPGGPVGNAPPPELCPPAPANLAPPTGETDGMALMRRGYHASRMFPVGDFSVDRWRQQRWGYYRLIEKVDREIGRVLNALRKGGHEENTVIVFTSDHGECAGAHSFNQKTVFYEESARVPMIVSWKGKTKPRSSDVLVNTGVDILPTLADFAKIKLPNTITGRSLQPIATGQDSSSWRDHIVIQNDMSQAAAVGDFRPQMQGRMVRTDRYKYCVYQYGKQRESLVDMQADPLELKNLAQQAEFQDTLAKHRKLLVKFGEQHEDKLVPELLQNNVGPRPFSKSR